MLNARNSAYAAIIAGCLAIGVSVAAIMNGPSETITTLELQDSATSQVRAEVEVPLASVRPDDASLADSPTIAAGFRAYQDENGNFVAPPPGTELPPVAAISGAPGAQFQSAVPGGGIGLDTRGYRMSQRAVENSDGEISIQCDPEQSVAHDHANHDEEH